MRYRPGPRLLLILCWLIGGAPAEAASPEPVSAPRVVEVADLIALVGIRTERELPCKNERGDPTYVYSAYVRDKLKGESADVVRFFSPTRIEFNDNYDLLVLATKASGLCCPEADTGQLGQGTSFMRGCVDAAEYRIDVAPDTFNLVATTIGDDGGRWVKFNDGFGWYGGEEATGARRDPRPGHQGMYIRWQELRSLILKWASSP